MNNQTTVIGSRNNSANWRGGCGPPRSANNRKNRSPCLASRWKLVLPRNLSRTDCILGHVDVSACEAHVVRKIPGAASCFPTASQPATGESSAPRPVFVFSHEQRRAPQERQGPTRGKGRRGKPSQANKSDPECSPQTPGTTDEVTPGFPSR